MKKTKTTTAAYFAIQRAIAQALMHAKLLKTFDEKIFHIEIIQVKERFAIQEIIQQNLFLQDLLQALMSQKKALSIFKIQTNFKTDFNSVLDFVSRSTHNLIFGFSSNGSLICYFTDSLAQIKTVPAVPSKNKTQSNLTFVFSEDSTTFEETKDVITSYAILNSHLRYSVRWFEEIDFLKIISLKKMFPIEAGSIASLAEVLEDAVEAERLLHDILNNSNYVLEERSYSTSLYFMSVPTPKECEVAMISELNTIPELTTSESLLFESGNDRQDAIKLDRFLGIRVREIIKTSKTKNFLSVLVYNNRIPICMNEDEYCYYNCFHDSLFKRLPQQIIQQIDPKSRKTYFPGLGISPDGLKKENFINSAEHIVFEYGRYLESQGTEIFLILNVSHNIDYLDKFKLENLKVKIASTLANDLIRYVEVSYQTLAQQEIFHSMGHKKITNLEPYSIPALASLLSELTDKINVGNDNLHEFVSLCDESRVDLLKKSLAKICLFENGLGGKNISKK